MSHRPLSPVGPADVSRIVEAGPFRFERNTAAVLWVLLVAGIAAFFIGTNGADPRAIWVCFLVNFVFWFCLAAASAGFSGVLHICNAQWARPIRRLFESCSRFLVFSPIFLVILYFGHDQIFVWAHEHIPGKGIWLTSQYVFIRDLLLMVFLIWLISKLVYHSLRRDLIAIRQGLTGVEDGKRKRWADKEYDPWVGDTAQDPRVAIRLSTSRIGRLSPLVVIFYALVMTFISFDLIMSVDPHWYSTLFGGLVFMSGVYMACAWAAVTYAFVRESHPLFRAKVERRTLHDLGKLMFGFGIFWAYMFWSHYLPAWYGNMPEETQWIIIRTRLEPWHGMAWLIFGSGFIVPFLLGLSRDVKQVPALLFATAMFILYGMWLQFYLLVAPTLYPDHIPLGWSDLFLTLGFASGFLLSQASFLNKMPLIPFGDFYEEEESAELKQAA